MNECIHGRHFMASCEGCGRDYVTTSTVNELSHSSKIATGYVARARASEVNQGALQLANRLETLGQDPILWDAVEAELTPGLLETLKALLDQLLETRKLR